MAEPSNRRVVRVSDVTLAWEEARGTFTFFGIPSVSFWLDPSLRNLLLPLARELGRERYRRLVIEHARLGTAEDFHAMVTELGTDFRTGFLAWGRSVGIAGWGAFELPVLDVAAGRATVVVRDPWELRLDTARQDDYGCPFILGKLEGIFGYALAGPCRGVDTVRQAANGDHWVEVELERVPALAGAPRHHAAAIDVLPVRGPDAPMALGPIGTLAGGIAHAFNNRLAAILGSISLAMAHGDPDGEQGRLLARAVSHCHVARQLAQQLLTFSGRGEPRCRPVALRDVVTSALERSVGDASRWTVMVDIPRDIPCVHADSDQLELALTELMNNACEAMPDGGTLAIAATTLPELETHGGDRVQISVSDTGGGLAELAHRHAFDLFFTTKPGAAGMGLSVAYAIAERHGGALELDAIGPAGGAVARLTLPAAAPPKVEERERDARTGMPRGLTVLLVDDDAGVLEVGRDMLAFLGCEVEVASGADEAIARYRAAFDRGHAPDVVVLDLVMPGPASGLDVLAALVALDPRARVIVSSGYFDEPVTTNPGAERIAAVLPKPYLLSELEAAISLALAAV